MEIYREYGNRAPGNRRVLVSRGLYCCTIPKIAKLATNVHSPPVSIFPNIPIPFPRRGEFGTLPNTWNWYPLHISGFIGSGRVHLA
jgi:hypothetical protein